MLASLTTTAVTRGWHPSVYSRLVQQLQDSSEMADTASVLDAVRSMIIASPPCPLLYEYICTLSKDPHSPIFFPFILNRLATGIIPRPQRLRELVCYAGRYAEKEWSLPIDHTNVTELVDSCLKLIAQAAAGVTESKVLVHGLAQSVLPLLAEKLPDRRAEIEEALKPLGIAPQYEKEVYAEANLGAESQQNDTVHDVEGSLSDRGIHRGHSSRAMRLLWLDWFLRTAQPLNSSNFRRQLEIVWPGDRDTVVSYELCVTAFDVFASPGSNKPPVLAESFILKALPLLLQQMGFEKSIDSVLSRVFTTLDKAVVESAEQQRPGIRAEFGMACVDIGLCDPTVLHALHRNHKPRPPLPSSDLPSVDDIISAPARFLELNPVNQYELAGSIGRAARGTEMPLGRHRLATLCAQLLRLPQFADALFVCIPLREFLEVICAYADAASSLPDEDGGAGLVYSDLGTLLATAKWLVARYQQVKMPDGWASSFIQRTKFANLKGLNAEQSTLMGNWIIGLFSGSGSGIADELLRPFKELGEVLPVLIRQAVRAYRSAVIDRETLKSGLDYFAHSFSVTLLAPLVVTILKVDLFEGTHQSTTLECLIFFFTIMVEKKDSVFDIAKAILLGQAKEIIAGLTAFDASATGPEANFANSSANLKKLRDAFSSLVNDLTKQVSPTFSFPTPDLFHLGETISLSENIKSSTLALMSWQLKPQGVPVIPSSYRHAKKALSTQTTRSLIEQITLPQSADTLTAILVCDGLWSNNGRLIEVDDSPISLSAGEVLKAFSEIANELPKPPEIVIGDAQLKEIREPGHSATNNIDNQVIQDVSSDVGPQLPTAEETRDDHSGASEGEIMKGITETNNANSVGFDIESSVEPNSQPVPTDFDNDFASQPMMNLADLDSAMDFGWD